MGRQEALSRQNTLNGNLTFHPSLPTLFLNSALGKNFTLSPIRLCARVESNHDFILRRDVSYPLYDERRVAIIAHKLVTGYACASFGGKYPY